MSGQDTSYKVRVAEQRRIKERPFEHQLSVESNHAIHELADILSDISKGNLERAAQGLLGAMSSLGFKVYQGVVVGEGWKPAPPLEREAYVRKTMESEFAVNDGRRRTPKYRQINQRDFQSLIRRAFDQGQRTAP